MDLTSEERWLFQSSTLHARVHSRPHEVQEFYFGYEHVLSIVEDSSKICVSGDSAGATLILSCYSTFQNRILETNS
jgi:acetyl esterase/lipase